MPVVQYLFPKVLQLIHIELSLVPKEVAHGSQDTKTLHYNQMMDCSVSD